MLCFSLRKKKEAARRLWRPQPYFFFFFSAASERTEADSTEEGLLRSAVKLIAPGRSSGPTSAWFRQRPPSVATGASIEVEAKEAREKAAEAAES